MKAGEIVMTCSHCGDVIEVTVVAGPVKADSDGASVELRPLWSHVCQVTGKLYTSDVIE